MEKYIIAIFNHLSLKCFNLGKKSNMFVTAIVKATYIIGIFPIVFSFVVKPSFPLPGDNAISRLKNNSLKHSSTEFDDFFVENDILNSVIKTDDDNRKFGQVIYDALKNDPEHVGQIDARTGKETTYKEMLDRSIRLALWMKKQGVNPNDTIVVSSHNHLNSYIPLFATFFVDAIFSGWNPGATLYTTRRFVKQFPPKLIFVNEKAVDVLLEAFTLEKSNAKLIVFGKHSKLLSLNDVLDEQTEDEVNNFSLVNVKSMQDVAAIIYSSGSSGFPKGTMLSNKLLLPPDAYDVPSTTTVRYLWYSTYIWITSLHFTFKTLLTKGTRILPAGENVEDFFQTIENYKVNYALIPLNLVSDLAISDVENRDLQSLKMILLTGAKINKEIFGSLKQRFPNAFVGQGYGTTEVGGFLSFTKPRSKHVEAAGILAPNCKVKIVNTTTGEILGANKSGELYAKSPAMMIGYYKNPEATKETIDREGWFHSGDLAYYDESGEIFIVSRIKEIIRYIYYDIYPAEIEEVLLTHPEVKEAIVVPVPVGMKGHRPVVFIKKETGSNITKDDIMKFTSVLEHYKQLKEIYFVDTIPRLPNGKVAKNELKERAEKLTRYVQDK